MIDVVCAGTVVDGVRRCARLAKPKVARSVHSHPHRRVYKCKRMRVFDSKTKTNVSYVGMCVRLRGARATVRPLRAARRAGQHLGCRGLGSTVRAAQVRDQARAHQAKMKNINHFRAEMRKYIAIKKS